MDLNKTPTKRLTDNNNNLDHECSDQIANKSSAIPTADHNTPITLYTFHKLPAEAHTKLSRKSRTRRTANVPTTLATKAQVLYKVFKSDTKHHTKALTKLCTKALINDRLNKSVSQRFSNTKRYIPSKTLTKDPPISSNKDSKTPTKASTNVRCQWMRLRGVQQRFCQVLHQALVHNNKDSNNFQWRLWWRHYQTSNIGIYKVTI